mmetsp:Transcript_118/g.348  ORF Transcript_118/g.348 Transcript_118/m.348 type:complete len:267 (+) Transcript_118:50-850(+)
MGAKDLRIVLTPVLRFKATSPEIPRRAGWTLHACGSKARDEGPEEGALSRALNRIAKLVNAQWHKSSEADPQSMRGRMYKYGQRLLSRLPAEEYFFRDLNAMETRNPSYIFPAKIGNSDAMQFIKDLTIERRRLHQKYLNGSIMLVPFSILFSFVPILPNIPLAWNLFRLYCHLSALRGARHLEDLLLSERLQLRPDEHMQKIMENASYIESASGIQLMSDETRQHMGELLNSPDLPKTLQRAVGQLGRQYGVPAAVKRVEETAGN